MCYFKKMFPKLSVVICFLAISIGVQSNDECNRNIINAVDHFLHTEYHRIKLPQRSVLGMVTLKDGRITDIGHIEYNVVETKRAGGSINLKTSGVLTSLNATYNCQARIGSCSKANVHITDLTSEMSIKMDVKTGNVCLLDITLNTGQYRLNGKLMGRPINLKDKIPSNLKNNLAKFIQSLANQTKIKADVKKCSYH